MTTLNPPGLFDMLTASPPKTPRDTQRAGQAHAAIHLRGVKQYIADILQGAGAVSCDGMTGGMTICELAAAVSDLRGKRTKQTTMTQPLKDLRLAGIVKASGKTRLGDSDVRVTVWESVQVSA